MKKLSVKKHGKIIIIKYYDLTDAWSIGGKYARRLIKSVYELEDKAEELIKENSWPFTKEAVVAYWFLSLDSISTGLHIYSNTSFKEISTKLVNAYADTYADKKQYCADVHEFIKNADDTVSYMQDWRKYDECNSLNYQFKFGFPQITMESFKHDPLGKMLELTDKMLNIIKDGKDK